MALHRRIAQVKQMGLGEGKVQEILQDIEKAANEFFQYLKDNDAWPVKPSLQLFLSPENNVNPKEGGEDQNDLLDRLHQELSALDSLSAKKEPMETEVVKEEKPKLQRGNEKGSAKSARGRPIKKGTKRSVQKNERYVSPTRLLSKMEDKADHIDETFTELRELTALSQPPWPATETKIVPIIQPKAADSGKDQNKHDRHMALILSDMSHLQAVLTLDELGQAVENCQFEHGSLGLIAVRQGRVIKCGNQKIDSATAVDIGKRRVTLGVGELARCLPLSKIDYDETERTLVLNGVPVELRCAK